MAGFATPKPVSQVDLPTGKDQIRKAGEGQKGSGAPSAAVLFTRPHWPWSWREAMCTAQGHSGQSCGIPQPMVTPQSSRDRTGASGKMENTRLWQSYARCRLGLEESDALECERKRNAEEGHVHAACGIQPRAQLHFTCPRRAQELSPRGPRSREGRVCSTSCSSHTHRRETAPLTAPQGERACTSQGW